MFEVSEPIAMLGIWDGSSYSMPSNLRKAANVRSSHGPTGRDVAAGVAEAVGSARQGEGSSGSGPGICGKALKGISIWYVCIAKMCIYILHRYVPTALTGGSSAS